MIPSKTLHVPADGGEWGAELVGDVAHQFGAALFGLGEGLREGVDVVGEGG